MRAPGSCIACLLFASSVSAGTHTVTNRQDSGPGSLRWAIHRANSPRLPGPDLIIFAPSLKGRVIYPATQLPTLTDGGTVINGDIDSDGTPDVALAGGRSGSPPDWGLALQATDCEVRGLAIYGFGSGAIKLYRCQHCAIVSCYLGVTLEGRRCAPGASTVRLQDSSGNVIGRTDPKCRNVIAPGKSDAIYIKANSLLYPTNQNIIRGNYIGLRPDGSTTLVTEIGATKQFHDGIEVSGQNGPAIGNVIGGEAQTSGNTFGGLTTAVKLKGAQDTEIVGNLFGLTADGDSETWINHSAVAIADASTGTLIGGSTAGARNVFAGGCSDYAAILVHDPGTDDTVISGNYFGTNRDGTQQRSLRRGVNVRRAGRTIVGGSTPAHGNHFTPAFAGGSGWPIDVHKCGPVTIRHNRFGILPQGGGTAGMGHAIQSYDSTVRIYDNKIARACYGVYVGGTLESDVSVQRNTFRGCDAGVAIAHGTCRLGNLGNSRSNDEGANSFKPTNTWFICNFTTEVVKAEGNIFPTTALADIDAKIYDKLDCPTLGRVDFDPLFGNVHPTDFTAFLTAATAVPTAAGAQIMFSLSAPAQVTITVLNLAGRPVATVTRDRALDGGMQRLLWNGRSDSGAAVPGGTYLVRIMARSADGSEGRALAPLARR